MISAFLNGMLSTSQENMEDLLTSCVFDLLRFSGTNEVLIKWLKKARTLDSERPFQLLTDRAEIEFNYWPDLAEDDCTPCIPDLVLSIKDKAVSYTVLIEAKYHSSKSSFPQNSSHIPTDQLAKEWDNLAKYASRKNTIPCLIYLTTSVGIPREDIQESLSELQVKRNCVDSTISWLSWRHLPHLVNDSENLLESELGLLLDHLELFMFDGFRTATHSNLEWGFDHLNSPIWCSQMYSPDIHWRFENGSK